ncbi:alpha-amylase family glycosyl hydrolase [Mangrovibacterium diazotrophicum]|uniref:Trehalose synthase n=1 Tax=Mangrovibacterium diazotrophicum TaxID=1261403 RepID=A0A419W465_9BACT|nr:alpha-amylase family glycosyl hydrolase [Mangrovibacterium diazotrophicum]RKD90237.1 trehalose synthase [Mangrovibacterium diazotrophicum]
MRKFQIITLLFILFVSSLAAQDNGFKPVPAWMKEAYFYQIYPQSFKDTDGDGIGDINGIIEKLDYIQSLGVNALWLNPCFESEFMDAGYDVTDFYKVAPRYGTNEDLYRLFAEAHKRGMHVCLDLVAGHTSDKHPWFIESQKKKRNAYTDRYIWTNDSTIKPDRYVSGKFGRNGNYRRNFFECQPALNYGFANPDPSHPWEQPVTAEGPMKTRAELMKIMDFWLEKGADGFRVDMAPSLIKNDPDKVETNKLWHEIRNHMQSKYPESVLIAEWGNPGRAIKAGFMMDFMIHLGPDAYSAMFFNEEGTYPRDSCYFRLDGKGTPTDFVKVYMQNLQEVGDQGFVSVPTANHDFQRPAAGSRNTVDQLKVAMTFFMTLKSIPLVYYGDEIGLKFIDHLPNKEGSLLKDKYNRAGTRTPMQWDTSAGAGFSTADEKDFYLPLDSATFRPNVASEEGDPSSLLNFTRELIRLRKATDALGMDGDINFVYAEKCAYPLAYTRSNETDTYLVVLNPLGKAASCNIQLEGFASANPVLVKNIVVSAGKTDLKVDADAVSYGIFKLEK